MLVYLACISFTWKRNSKMRQNRDVMNALVMVFQFGINMIVPILMCTLLGVWIGNKTGVTWVVIPLFFMGALAGGNNIYRMSKKLMNNISTKRYTQDVKKEQ